MERMMLEAVLKEAWDKETSADPENWTREKPAWGQCAVTALIVNDYFGGRLLWAAVKLPDGKEISHYFNEIGAGEVVDLTKTQFPEGTIIPEGCDKKKNFQSTRDYVLSYPPTVQRYACLKERVQKALAT